MNLDPVPPVRPLLTHVIPGELVRHEAGITYDNCPKLPDCPAHKDEFEVYSKSYHAKTLNAQLPPPFPLPYTGSGLRAEVDTKWWPVPPSNSSPSPPGSPVDPYDILVHNPPPEDDSHLPYFRT